MVGITAILFHSRLPSLPRSLSFLSKSFSTMSPKPVIVVGSGLAGLSAAYEALAHGAPAVHVLDRAPKPGGNSIKASSGINGANTRFQRAHGIHHDEHFYPDTVKSAGKRFHANPEINRAGLVKKLTDQSADAVHWLVDEIGVDLSVVAPLGGHSVARTHRGGGKLPPGAAIISGLLDKLKANDKFTLMNHATVKRLLQENGAVKGVEYDRDGKGATLEGTVVFASGGFAGDARGLLAKHRPDLEGMPSTNEERPGSHDILTAAGAELVAMDSVQIHPTGFVDPAAPQSMLKFLAGELLRGEGGIMLADGKRFVNELDTRAVVSGEIMKLPPKDTGAIRQWDITLLLDPGTAKATAGHLGFYEWKGLMRKVKLASLPAKVIAAVDKYSEEVASGAKDEFGRPSRGAWSLAPGDHEAEVHVGRITPIVHFTMGGVAIDQQSHVLTRKDSKLVPIPGLVAAGEITGGIHGDNRLGGSSLLECVVYGRTAGVSAAKGE